MENGINEFEKVILDSKNTGEIKYKVDNTMEASVKYQFLCESYGKERVDEFLIKNNMSIADLCGDEQFKLISSKLTENI